MKKIIGVRSICQETQTLYPYCGYYVKVGINVATGELVSAYLSANSFVDWADGVIPVAKYWGPMTMTAIKADAIKTLQEKGVY